MESSNSTNKRRLTADDSPHISILPTGFIVDVSAYLSKPSRAILAVAFSAPSTSWKNDNLMHRPSSPISTAIVSASQWDTLNFEDVERELAKKLTDDDIYAILKCISAQDVLRKLKLCGCINITGIGLSPLPNSAALELIDISIVGKYETPYNRTEPKISEEAVLPILDSIISANGCSLKYIQFPQKWRDNGISSMLEQFGRRYTNNLNNRGIRCTICEEDMDYCLWIWFEPEDNNFYHNNTCYNCLKPVCDVCIGDGRQKMCDICFKDYCTDCSPVVRCNICDDYSGCIGCSERCDICDETWCIDCVNGSGSSFCTQVSPFKCSRLFECVYCNKKVCKGCPPCSASSDNKRCRRYNN